MKVLKIRKDRWHYRVYNEWGYPLKRIGPFGYWGTVTGLVMAWTVFVVVYVLVAVCVDVLALTVGNAVTVPLGIGVIFLKKHGSLQFKSFGIWSGLVEKLMVTMGKVKKSYPTIEFVDSPQKEDAKARPPDPFLSRRSGF